MYSRYNQTINNNYLSQWFVRQQYYTETNIISKNKESLPLFNISTASVSVSHRHQIKQTFFIIGLDVSI